MGNAGRGRRSGAGGRVCRTRQHRCAAGSRRSASHGRVRRRRPVPPGGGSARSGRRHRRKRGRPHRPGSPRRVAARRRIDAWTSTSERSCSPPPRGAGRRFTSSAATSSSSAAKQRRGHLRVLTRDSIASVKGTVFAVSAGLGGSVVSVVEGSVAVSQPGREVLLSPGQQAASNPALASSVAASRRLESRGGRVPGAAGLVREDRTPAGGEFPDRAAHQLRPARRIFPPAPSPTAPFPTLAAGSARRWSWRSSNRPRTPRSAPGGTPRRDSC